MLLSVSVCSSGFACPTKRPLWRITVFKRKSSSFRKARHQNCPDSRVTEHTFRIPKPWDSKLPTQKHLIKRRTKKQSKPDPARTQRASHCTKEDRLFHQFTKNALSQSTVVLPSLLQHTSEQLTASITFQTVSYTTYVYTHVMRAALPLLPSSFPLLLAQ
ncbi:hypothetical protein BDW02DRAFT_36988 [Decorospora gaudefroyi]|uniref:Uncharacterized protein n=1 Tax=Decorospora gaudefroyi TaxID=184978 RepID=A0A6A5KBF4_9PLEO|nr:hypothetical protein BDW02DRAFT_36988 [Decorospora gaudefroyi]